jgi:hypothetical protein
MLPDAARRAAAHAEPLEAPSGYRLHATEVPGTGGLVELAQALGRPPAATTVRAGTVKIPHG